MNSEKIWVERDDSRGEMILVRNYLPQLVIDPSKDKKLPDEISIDDQHIVLAKSQEAKFDQIKEKDILLHQTHGYLKVRDIEMQDEKRKAINCALYVNGKTKREEKRTLTEDDMRDLVSSIKVTVRLHLNSGEVLTQELLLPIRKQVTIGDIVEQLT